MTKEGILERAVEILESLTDIRGEVEPYYDKNGIEAVDISVMNLRYGTSVTTFNVRVKNELRETALPDLLETIKNYTGEWLFIYRYIPKPLRAVLRDQGINYLETSGNCSIKAAGLYVYINDRAVTEERQPADKRLWKATGLKFLFGIIVQPELLNQSYREIARKTKVAVGNIGLFMDELKELGYIKQGSGQGTSVLVIDRKEALEKRWIELYGAILKPKLVQGRYHFLHAEDRVNWRDLPMAMPVKLFWGGEAAGALMTGHLRPEKFTVYTNAKKSDVMRQLKLVPDSKGEVEVVDIFWDLPLLHFLNFRDNTVPPFLAYAELSISLDSRNRETADKIKKLI